MHGVVWFEIYVDDLRVASDFYKKTLGWSFAPLGDYSDDYWTIEQIESGTRGALVKVGTQLPQAVAGRGACIVYSEVGDLSDALDRVESAGGQVEKDITQITKDAGYFAIASTQQGALVGLWSDSPGGRFST